MSIIQQDAQPRAYGAVNWIGLRTLCAREVGRFMKVSMQTVFAPVVSTILYMVVFKLAFGQRDALGGDFANVAFADFLAPGLIMMAILNNAFQNTSSSIIVAKIQGNHVDFLMPPLSPLELTVGFLVGATVRGILVAAVSAVVIALTGLADLNVHNFGAIVWFALMASVILGAVGAVGGVWAEKFDHLAAVTNFVILPMTFLSGTFFDINALPEPFRTLSHLNPFFFLIDGFRYGFIGAANSHLITGMAVTGTLALVLSVWVWWLFRTGYKLKA